MKTLNLAYPEKSDVKFTISKFPDGQQSVDISSTFLQGDDIKIEARIRTFRDLEIIIAANQALKEIGVKNFFYFLSLLGPRIGYIKIKWQNIMFIPTLEPTKMKYFM
jgi:hypothetical protein